MKWYKKYLSSSLQLQQATSEITRLRHSNEYIRQEVLRLREQIRRNNAIRSYAFRMKLSQEQIWKLFLELQTGKKQ